MKTRVIVGSLLVLLMIAVLYFGGFILLSMLALFSIAAIYEMGLTFRKKSYNPILIPAYVFALAYPFVDFYFGLLSLIILYMATVMATMIWSLFAKRRTTNDIIPSLFILSYPTLFLICMHLVYFSFERPVALVAACMAYAAPECADTFAYFGGTFLGKHKLCPTISPKKTVEGAIFGVVGGTIGGLICRAVFVYAFHMPMPGIPAAIALGLIGSVAGEIGDLSASLLKRHSGIKDYGKIFPGHGGVMDRFDSVIFTLIVMYCYTLVL